MHAWKRPLALVVSAALLVVGFDLATYAATGDSLIVGKTNKANKATTLKRTTGGAVLSLKAKKGSTPLAVNSTTRVDNLNADLVDGLSSSELATNTTTVNLGLTVDESDPTWNVSLPDGTYLVNWQAYVDLVDSGSELFCAFAVGTDFLAGGGTPPTSGFVAAPSGSGVVTFNASNNEQFFCNAASGNIEAFAGVEGIELVFQRVEGNTAVNVPANP